MCNVKRDLGRTQLAETVGMVGEMNANGMRGIVLIDGQDGPKKVTGIEVKGLGETIDLEVSVHLDEEMRIQGRAEMIGLIVEDDGLAVRLHGNVHDVNLPTIGEDDRV